MTLATMNQGYSDPSLLNALLSGQHFWPTEPKTLHEVGLTEPFVDALVSKYLLAGGNATGRTVSADLALPFPIIEASLERLRQRRLVTHVGAGRFNDYVYGLSEEGRDRARVHHRECSYVGPAPVPLDDYIISVEAQAIGDEPVRQADLKDAFHDVSVAPTMLDLLGPAVNSASGMFLYGSPGNGKSTLANRITSCFGQSVWLPHAVIDGREIITLFDPAYHHRHSEEQESHDKRWVLVRRPTVVVGGELTMDSLEISHDPVSNISEAPLQMKSNCGCLLIDDFGRQRISPEDLLNRWIIPLENRHDYLTLSTGKKIQFRFPSNNSSYSQRTLTLPTWWTRRSCVESPIASRSSIRTRTSFITCFKSPLKKRGANTTRTPSTICWTGTIAVMTDHCVAVTPETCCSRFATTARTMICRSRWSRTISTKSLALSSHA